MSYISLYLKCSIVLFGLGISCNKPVFDRNDILEQNLKRAGKNRPELERVLAHYSSNPGDSLKYKSAVFLISNMESSHHFVSDWQQRFDPIFFKLLDGRDDDGVVKLRDSVIDIVGHPDSKKIRKINDLEYLTADYLIKNIDEAYASWRQAPWADSISFDTFCNYILPYKAENEPPEDWRKPMVDRYGYLFSQNVIPHTMVDFLCALVDEQIWFDWTNRIGYYPGVLSFNQIMQGKKGACNEMANLGLFSARALGIPAASDYIPQYGSINDVHNWNALILSDNKFIHFEGTESRPGDMAYLFEKDHKFAKVYRHHAAWVPSSYAAQAMQVGIFDIPEYLVNPRMVDVTSYYTKVANIKLQVRAPSGTPVYLAISKWRTWVAMAGSFVQNNEATFSGMGRGLVYLPVFYNKGNYKVAGPPFLLPAKEDIETLKLNEDEKQDMTLERKYAFKRSWTFIIENSMTGARFEGSNDPDFKEAVLLHQIDTPWNIYQPKILNDLSLKDRGAYDSSWTEVRLVTKAQYRYVRLIFNKPLIFRLGEMEFYGPEEDHALHGHPIGTVPDPIRAFDGFPGKVIKLPNDTMQSHWVGLDFNEKKWIDRIRYIPATDGNAVQAGKTYELYYWKDTWISAGVQKSNGLPLVYKNIPAKGVYWLNCLDCNSKEERIFTYENGKQVFW